LKKLGRCLRQLALALVADPIQFRLTAELLHVGIFTKNACHSDDSFGPV
jgi:hypothetical protein